MKSMRGRMTIARAISRVWSSVPDAITVRPRDEDQRVGVIPEEPSRRWEGSPQAGQPVTDADPTRAPDMSQVPRQRRWSGGRTLHLVDLENLLGTTTPAPGLVRSVLSEYLRKASWREGDLVVLGMSRHTATWAGFEVPDGLAHRVVTRDGVDGADLALLEECDNEPLHRVERVVIGSGDHAFLAAMPRLRADAAAVWVVGRAGATSRRLRMAADRVEMLSPLLAQELSA